MNITPLREYLNTQNFSEQYPNVTGWCISTKEVDSIDTNEICIKFFVTKKRPLDELLPHEIIPEVFTVDGVDVVTDVLETGSIKTLDSYTISEVDSVAPAYDVQDTVENTIQTTTYFNNTDVYAIPLSISRNIHRPLKGGISSIHVSGTDATLGLIVKDNTDNSIVCLSNNHVYAQSQMSGYLAIQGTNLNTSALSARQPASSSYTPYGGPAISPQHTIGKHKRCKTLTIQDNDIDAAIVQLRDYNIISSVDSNQVVGFNVSGPYEFASTQEIDSLLTPNSPNFNAPIFRSGRTLGPLGFPGNIFSKNTHEAPLSELTSLTGLTGAFNNVKYVRTPFGTAIFGFNGTDVYHCGYGTFNGVNVVVGGSRVKFEKLPRKFKNIWFERSIFIGLGEDNKLYSSGFSSNYQTNYVNVYTPLSSQLLDYDNTEIKIWGANLYALKNKKINVLGQNSLYGTLGYGLSSTETKTWVELPGDWDQVEIFNNSLIALSGNKIFYSTPIYYNGAQTPRLPLANTPYTLNSNILNIGNFKKILDCSIYSTTLFALSTNDILCEISHDPLYGTGTTLRTYPSFNGNIKAINNNDVITGVLSGGDIYIKRLPYTENFTLSPVSDLLKNISTSVNTSSFTKITGITANDVFGTFYSKSWLKETLVINSNNGFGVLGFNDSSCFGVNFQTNDKIIIDSIGTNVNVSGFIQQSTLLFRDCITLRSKEKAFPVTQGGDSGTAVFALLSSNIPSLSTWKCIGLIFAGPPPTNQASGIICRIDNIVNALNISPWNGIIPQHIPNIKNIRLNVQNTTAHTITLSGRKFYNIGLNTQTLSTAIPTTTTTAAPTTTTTAAPTTTTTPSPTPSTIQFSSPGEWTPLTNSTLTVPGCALSVVVSGTNYNLYRIWQLIITYNNISNAITVQPINMTLNCTTTGGFSNTKGGHIMSYYNSGITNSFVLSSDIYGDVPGPHNRPLSARIIVNDNYFNQPLSVTPTTTYCYYKVYSYYSTGNTINIMEEQPVDYTQILNNLLDEANNRYINV